MNLDIIFAMECDDCGSVFEISTTEDNANEPIYCPFCGSEILEAAEYEEEDDTYSENEFAEFEKEKE